MDPIVLKPGGGEAINVAGNDVMFKAEGEREMTDDIEFP